MNERICPFSATLAKDDFGCRHAQQVIRRGGTEFTCREISAHERCRRLFERLKAVALPAFGVEDDLAVMPQSVLVKIQFGGLLGLRRIIADGGPPDRRIEDIDSVLASLRARYPQEDNIPFARLVEDITGYRLPRRRGR